jgi:putative iron-dependent peroxidase
MTNHQPAILQPVPAHARHLLFDRRAGADPRGALGALRALADGESVLVGIGDTLVRALGARIAGLRTFPSFAGSPEPIPCTPADLWIWLRADDRGDLYHASRAIEAALCDAFEPIEVIDVFRHADSRDLSGYEDGTENPQGEDAERAALVMHGPLRGSSFAALQRWTHDFRALDAMSQPQRDDCIGRRRDTNEELDDAPASAHVKRTAQESFDPEAFVVRRSMPWVDGQSAGLMFLSFAASADPFEVQMRRMSGLDDGIVDALFAFTRPVTGATFWCPGLADGRIDLSPLGL